MFVSLGKKTAHNFPQCGITQGERTILRGSLIGWFTAGKSSVDCITEQQDLRATAPKQAPVDIFFVKENYNWISEWKHVSACVHAVRACAHVRTLRTLHTPARSCAEISRATTHKQKSILRIF
jgi:hypothetical protein